MRIRKIILIFAILMGIFGTAMSQEKNCQIKKSKEIDKRYNDAINLMSSNNNLGIRYIEDIANTCPHYYPATLVMGEYYLNAAKDAQIRFNQKLAKENIVKAKKFLTLSYQNCPNYDSLRATLLLGECNFISRKYDDARNFLNEFLSNDQKAKSLVALAQKRIEMINDYFDIISHPIQFNPKMLRNVSTKDDEYLPLISHDGTILLYTHRFMKRTGDYVEELMMSRLDTIDDKGELFKPGVKMPKPFNMGRLQGGASLTIDNKILYITICSQDDCDIYYSKFENNEWQPLIKLPNTVNTEYFDGQPTIDPTGNVLYFSSNRPGGFGGYDLYKIVRKNEDSLWSAPINLGPSINTEFDEKTPFIHCDGKTLYFASNGHGGVGGFDIFYSRLQENGEFGKPKNIGYPLNTENDEVAYIVSADGRRIYFSAKLLSGEGGWDVYCAELKPPATPNEVLLIKGTVTDDDGLPVPDVNVDITGLKTFESSHSKTDRKTGQYAVSTTVNKDEDYMLTLKKKGYIHNVQFIVPDSANYTPPTTEDVKINKIKTGVPFELDNVNFPYNSSRLTEHSKAYLQQLAIFLTENANFHIELLGHTDGVGNEESNLQLSERRCNTVLNYLVMLGIDRNRLSFKAYGKSSPKASNSTDNGRAQNRRVEMILTNSKKN